MDRHVTRRAVVVTAAATLAGCGANGTGDSTPGSDADEDDSTATDNSEETATPTGTPGDDNPALGNASQVGDLTLTSSAFDDGESIPREYGHDEENVNPPLTVEAVPGDTETLTLIVDDPDAVDPAGKVWLHWLVWNVPASRTEIPEGWEPADGVVGENDFGNRRYDGPAPPDERHTYRFKCYALDTTLDVPESASKRDVGAAMDGHVLAQTQLTGTYAPSG